MYWVSVHTLVRSYSAQLGMVSLHSPGACVTRDGFEPVNVNAYLHIRNSNILGPLELVLCRILWFLDF